MTIRFSIPNFSPASVYTIAVHNTSAESIGVRLDGADRSVRGWVRSQSLTRHASATGDPMMENTAHVMGVTWKSEEATVFGNLAVYTRTWPGQSNPNGLNELRIGQRNSGSDPIFGHVTALRKRPPLWQEKHGLNSPITPPPKNAASTASP